MRVESLLVSFVVPCFNEAKTIASVLGRLAALRINGARTEIVVVNDGSTDTSAKVLDSFVFPPDVPGRIYHAPTNLGKGTALRIGMSLARGDVIAFQDADLETDPADLPKLIAPVLAGEADIMFGSRFFRGVNKGIPRKTWVANWFLSKLTSVLFGGWITDMETAYKIFTREVGDRLRLRCAEFDIEPEITAKMLRLGYRIRELPMRYMPRGAADGKHIGLYDGVQAIWTLVRTRFVSKSRCERPRRVLAPTVSESDRREARSVA